MKILIVAATKEEIKPLINLLRKNNHASIPQTIRYNEHEITPLITGVGMTCTAYEMGKIIHRHFAIAINMGICGSFDRNIKMGTVVNVVEDCFADLGAEDGETFLTLEEMGMQAPVKTTRRKTKSRNNTIDHLPKVSGITVNTVHGNKKSIEKVKKKFNPQIESMEGAAFRKICTVEKIEHLQIRSISNYVEERNKEAWNIPLALTKLNEKVFEIINSL